MKQWRRPRRRQTPGAADVGDRVLISGLGLEGIVVMLHDREAEVDVRGKRFRAHTGDLRVLGGATQPEPAAVRVNVQVQPRERRPASCCWWDKPSIRRSTASRNFSMRAC